MIFRKIYWQLEKVSQANKEMVEMGFCPDCDGQEWHIFLLQPNYVPHVECCSCGALFGVPGEAATEPGDTPQRVLPGENLRITKKPPSEN